MTQHNSSKPRPITHEEAESLDEGQTQQINQVTSQDAEQLTDQLGDFDPELESPSHAEPVFSARELDSATSSQSSKNNPLTDGSQSENVDELALNEQWRCVICDHLEVHNTMKCSSCRYWRVELACSQPLNTNAVHSKHVNHISDQSSDDEVLATTFARLQTLFARAQQEGKTLGDKEQARLYEALLISLLRIERASIKKVMLKDFFGQEREERRRTHMIHLSIIWFLGICTGFALYFGLQSVSG